MDFETYTRISTLFSESWENAGNAAEREEQINISMTGYSYLAAAMAELNRETIGEPLKAFIDSVQQVAQNVHNELHQPHNLLNLVAQQDVPRMSGEAQKKCESLLNLSRGLTMVQRTHLLISMLGTCLSEMAIGYVKHAPRLNVPPGVQAESASYVSWKALAMSVEDIRTNAGAQLEALHSGLEKIEAQSQLLVDTAQTKLAEMVGRSDGIAQKYSNTEAAARQLIEDVLQKSESATRTVDDVVTRVHLVEKRVDVADSNITAHAIAIEEKLRINSTKELWSKRAERNSKTFWFSAGAIALLFIAPPVVAVIELDALLAFIERIGTAIATSLPPGATGAQATIAAAGHLVVITIPIILYLWMMKLVVRFNQRSLALADDAAQRGAIMDTYFHLIEHQAAGTEERALVLNALFRPGPGQSDNVEPPNFVELVSAMKGANG